MLQNEAALLMKQPGTGHPEFTMGELTYVLDRLNKNSATGLDGIHNNMLANLPPSGLHFLLHLANTSLSESVLPSEWKTANVKMLPKKALSNDPSKYRPISLTSCVGKLIERLVANRLTRYLDQNNIIKKEQSGFRKHRSTIDNLLFMSQKGVEAINRGKSCVAIFFDIEKAFDKVWHEGIINRLYKYQVPYHLTRWIINFLAERSFQVEVNGKRSRSKSITAGVPQGAVLSPILFSLYINEAPITTSKLKLYSLLFADDLVTIGIFRDSKQLVKALKLALKNLETWLKEWRLKIAVNKCNYTIFSACKKLPEDLDLTMYGERINYDPNPKFLGIVFDKRLTFAAHISSLKQRFVNRLAILKVLSHRTWKLSKATLATLYGALIRSVIDYSAFFASAISISQMTALQRLQNKAIKIIYRPAFKTNLIKLARTHGIIPVSARLAMLNTNYVWKSVRQRNPIIIDLIKEYLNYFAPHGEPRPSPLSQEKNYLFRFFHAQAMEAYINSLTFN